MESVKHQAQEIVNSNQLWSQLNADEKISVLRVSMGLPPSVDYSIHTTERIEQSSNEEHYSGQRGDLSHSIVCDKRLNQVEDRTLFVKIHLEEYLISCEVLNQVSLSVGNLEIIEKFDDGAQFHSRIRFQNRDSALKAFNCYNGRCIYDGCYRMELFIDGRSSSKSGEFEALIEDVSHVEEIKQLESNSNSNHGAQSVSKETESSCEKSRNEFFLKMSEIADPTTIAQGSGSIQSSGETLEEGLSDNAKEIKSPGGEPTNSPEETCKQSCPLESNFKGDAHKVFDEMPNKGNSVTLETNLVANSRIGMKSSRQEP